MSNSSSKSMSNIESSTSLITSSNPLDQNIALQFEELFDYINEFEKSRRQKAIEINQCKVELNSIDYNNKKIKNEINQLIQQVSTFKDKVIQQEQEKENLSYKLKQSQSINKHSLYEQHVLSQNIKKQIININQTIINDENDLKKKKKYFIKL